MALPTDQQPSQVGTYEKILTVLCMVVKLQKKKQLS